MKNIKRTQRWVLIRCRFSCEIPVFSFDTRERIWFSFHRLHYYFSPALSWPQIRNAFSQPWQSCMESHPLKETRNHAVDELYQFSFGMLKVLYNANGFIFNMAADISRLVFFPKVIDPLSLPTGDTLPTERLSQCGHRWCLMTMSPAPHAIWHPFCSKVLCARHLLIRGTALTGTITSSSPLCRSNLSRCSQCACMSLYLLTQSSKGPFGTCSEWLHVHVFIS